MAGLARGSAVCITPPPHKLACGAIDSYRIARGAGTVFDVSMIAGK